MSDEPDATGTSAPSAADDAELARALEGFLSGLEAGRRPNAQQLLAEHPAIAERLRTCLASLQFLEQAAGDLSAGRLVAEAEPAGGTLGDYRLLREVGRGGMGVVYEAEQISLRRRVALKVLPYAAVLDKRALARFKNEALAAAALDHPNIVPLFGIGCERSIHFYAMRFIDGPTLADCIRELQQRQRENADLRFDSLAAVVAASSNAAHKAATGGRGAPLYGSDRADTANDPTAAFTPANGEAVHDPATPCATASSGATAVSAVRDAASVVSVDDTAPDAAAAAPTRRSFHTPAFFRSVAELAAQIADALDHAHEQGVIHRDIKPSNLILDQQGKPFVADFGLARIGSDTAMTVTGDLVGTLRYMSPEQALARRVGVDHRTDIYSLGATLYELLALRPAFPSENREELLRQIASEEPAPLRRLNKAIPADLETILLKAISKEPADRYATAADLAADLRRYVADQPVKAKRPGALKRVSQWSRRHQSSIMAVTMLSVILAIAGCIIAANQISLRKSADDNAEEASQSAITARKAEAATAVALTRANSNLNAALDVLDKTYLAIAEREMPSRQADASVDDEDRALLETALSFYEFFATTNQDSPVAQRQVAAAYMRVGNLRRLLGDDRGAADASRESLRLFDVLVSRYPDDVDLAVYRADAQVLLAKALREDRGVALRLTRDCISDLRRLRLAATEQRDLPIVRRVELVLSDALSDLSDCLQSRGNLDEAFSAAEEAVTLCRSLHAHRPTDIMLARKLFFQLENMHSLQTAMTDWNPDSAILQEALDIGNTVLSKHSSQYEVRSTMMVILISEAERCKLIGQLDAAVRAIDEAIAHATRLTVEQPGVPEYLRGLAVAHSNRGQILVYASRWEEARASYLAALAAHAHLTTAFPDTSERRRLHASCLCGVGRVQMELGDTERASQCFREAIAALRALVGDDEEGFLAHHKLAEARCALARLLAITGQPTAAEEILTEQIHCCHALVARHPDNFWARQALAHAHMLMGLSIGVNHARQDAAIAELQIAIDGFESLLAQEPMNRRLTYELAEAYFNVMVLADGCGRTAEARDATTETIRLCRECLSMASDDIDARSLLARALDYVAMELLSAGGRVQEALDVAREARRIHEQIYAADPAVVAFADTLVVHCVNVGRALHNAGLLGEAEESLRRATAVAGERAESATATDQARLEAAAASCGLAVLLGALGRVDEAESRLREAIGLMRELDPLFAKSRECLKVQADASGQLGSIYLVRGESREGVKEMRAAQEIWQKLAAAHPEVRIYIDRNLAMCLTLGTVLRVLGDYDGATDAYREADAALSQLSALGEVENTARSANNVAWCFTVYEISPDLFDRAVTAARLAVRISPSEGAFWNTLGIALCKAGVWNEATDALCQSVRLSGGGSAHDFFFLAMAHWQLGNTDEAAAWHARGVAWMDANAPGDEELLRFRAEAEDLLGIPPSLPVREDMAGA